MIGIEFGAPQSLKLKAAWGLLETVNTGLFCQLITIPLFKEHKILVQVAGHASHTVKLLPSLVLTDADCDWIERAFDSVIADSHRVPGAVWSLGKTLAATGHESAGLIVPVVLLRRHGFHGARNALRGERARIRSIRHGDHPEEQRCLRGIWGYE